MQFLKIKDPLILYNIDANKSENLLSGIKAIDGKHIFTPSLLSLSSITGGNGQTIMITMKEKFLKTFYSDFVYTSRELFSYKDGGKTHIDIKGELKDRPIIFIAPGLTSDSQAIYVRSMVNQAYSKGFDVVVINYRGLTTKLYTPKLFNSNAY